MQHRPLEKYLSSEKLSLFCESATSGRRDMHFIWPTELLPGRSKRLVLGGRQRYIPIYNFPNTHLQWCYFQYIHYYSHRFPAGLPSQVIPFWDPDCFHFSLLFLHFNSTFLSLHIFWLIISVALSSPVLHRCPHPCNTQIQVPMLHLGNFPFIAVASAGVLWH